MKKFTIAFFLLLVAGLGITQAQNQKVSVSGTVLDEDGEGIMQATVQILNSAGKYVNGAASLQNGHFQLPAVAPGKYTVKISFVGYASDSRAVTLTSSKPSYNIGKITLKPDAIMMKEAVVTAAAAQVQVKEDTLVYNSDAFRVPEGSALEELVKKLPGAEVDSEGNITVNGKEIKKILVDGKEYFSSDTKVAMKNLPVEMVDKIKSYDKKSDLARVTGIDDGEEETVLDLTVKKGMQQGWFGNADMGLGTKSRYSAKAMANRFTDKSQISAVGSANNTNDNGFPGGGGGFRMGGNKNGLNALKMGGINFAWDSQKWEVGGNVRYSHADGDVMSNASSEEYLSSGSLFGNSKGKTLTKSNSVNFDFRIEWKPDTMTNVIFRPSASYGKSDNYSNKQSATFNADPVLYSDDPLADLSDLVTSHRDIMVNSNSNKNQSTSKNYTANAELQLNRRLNNKGRNVTFRTTAGYSKSDSKSSTITETDYYQLQNVLGGDSVYFSNRYLVTPTRNWNYSAQVTYSEPIARATFLQFSYKFSYKYQKSDRSTYSFDRDQFGMLDLFELPANYESSYVDSLSQYATNKYYNHDISLMLRLIRQKYSMNVGVSLQPQTSTTSYTKGAYSIDTTRNVVNFTPTFDFRYRFSKVQRLRITYRGSSSQPSINDLLPVTDNSNPLNIRTGNPGLKPSFSNSFRLMYNDYNQERQRGIMTMLFFNNTLNSISNRSTVDSQTGAKTTMPENINGNWNIRGSVNFNTALSRNKKFTLNTNTDARYTNAVAYYFQESTKESLKNTTRTTKLGERLTGTYRTDFIEFSLNGSLSYSHSRNLFQESKNEDTYDFSYGASTNVYLPWNMTVSTDLSNSSRRGYSIPTFNTNELVWNAQISQNFLKGNAATVSLQFYDILGKMSNLSRSITASGRSDTQYNSINSYCMLHLIYRFNVFGSKEAREKMRGRGGFRPDGMGGGGNRPPRF